MPVNKLNLRSETRQIILLFLSWRLFLLGVLVLSIKFIPLAQKDKYLGGGALNYSTSPELFSWVNFDGEHYLSIAIFGYKMLEQAFFPIYPLTISFFSKLISTDYFSLLINSVILGLIISNGLFLLSLIFLFELISLDFPKKIALMTIILLLVFPTSFYFGSFYSESLFLFLSIVSFYFARKKNWFFASIFGMLSSATRIFGIILLPAFLIETWIQKEKLSKSFWVILIPLGTGLYMLYQYLNFGDPLAFYNLQKLVGEQHQSGIITLPQVYFRYIKMLLTVDVSNPIYQTIWLEFLTGLLFFILPIYGYFKKIRLSYLLYAMVGFLLPTIQGSFSSTPRYILVLFPSFLALAIFWSSLSRMLKIIFLGIFFISLTIETALFLRGYWVA